MKHLRTLLPFVLILLVVGLLVSWFIPIDPTRDPNYNLYDYSQDNMVGKPIGGDPNMVLGTPRLLRLPDVRFPHEEPKAAE